MTQTSETPSVSTLLNQAWDLHAAISTAMENIKNTLGPIQPDEWHDLKIAFDAAGLAASQLHQIAKRQRAADEPVPYTVPDDLDLPF